MSSNQPSSRRSPSSSTSPGNRKPPKATSTSKRLLQELSQLRAQEANPTAATTEISPIERLGPVSDDEFFHWEAVINGKGLGGGYDGGRWLLDIRVPDGNSNGGGGGSYPNAPPVVRFVTRICAANVGFEVSYSFFFFFFVLHIVLLFPDALQFISWANTMVLLFTDAWLDRGDMFGSVEDGVDSGVYAQDDGRGDMADVGGTGDR